ncbi:LysR substrate-binding domain-containing protein [Vreelandella sp. TE19]
MPAKALFKPYRRESRPGAALAGIGIAMLPNVQISEDIRAGRLVPLLADYSLPQRPMHLLYHQDHYRSPKLRSFIDFAVEAFGN